MRVSSETEVIGMLPLSPPLEAQPFISEEGDAKSEEIKDQDDAQGGFCGKEVIGVLPVSMAFGAEPLLYEGDGSTTVEVGSHNDITGSHSESEDIGRMPVSLPSEAEPVLDEGGVKVVEVGTQNDIMTVSSETEVIGKLPLSQPLEAEPSFCEEGDAKKVEGVTENDIKGGSSESKVILTLLLPPPLEVQPIRDNEAEIGRTEILDESFRRGTVIMTNTSSEIMEVEVNKQSAAIDEPVDSSDSDKTVSKPIITDLQSKKIVLEKLFLSSGTASFPHPEKALAGGEDAYFTYQNWLGVADGVSQWSLEGVDLGKYAHEVMEIARELVSNCCDSPVTSPEEVLNLAVDRAHYTGSSTVLISHFDGQQDLHVANIGDSGIIILRNDAVCQRSSPMYHVYNFPVLIQKVDGSKLVEQYTFNLDEGDVVVAATDGLFDNLYEEDIISIVSKSLEANINPKEIAEILAMRAQEVGASTCTRSPFSDEAQAAGYTGCTGGKLDDVVVVVSLVKKRSDFQPS
ncbi:hypothetical protein Leryth_024831 [Lithospermum erythrorhizon]|nr:hypothetical protein Leryth_024831 [Lithospermum erythrorhizon]